MNVQLHEIVKPLLQWYDAHARILPWRSRPTPYRVWVSEIMLQQTRVETVLPYFEQFVAALPDVHALARADADLLLKLWEGLGYYSRVRNLQKAARVVTAQYGGVLPDEFDALCGLPGLGAYSAGAVASIAFGRRVPAVDGNVLRVIARVTADRAPITDAAVKKRITQAVTGILPTARVGDFNQSLMELGATVCLPNGVPKCGECPLAALCMAREQGLCTLLPVKAPKKARSVEYRTVLVLMCGERLAVRRRGGKGLLAGMWELPSLDGVLSPDA
ncbi:MAG: A/G-specific adenine glycosylase, partial [Acetanaerobacterium sp.]